MLEAQGLGSLLCLWLARWGGGFVLPAGPGATVIRGIREILGFYLLGTWERLLQLKGLGRLLGVR